VHNIDTQNRQKFNRCNGLQKLSGGFSYGKFCPVLPYLGKRFDLWPSDAVTEAKALSVIGFFAAAVHPAHAHVSRPERYAADPAVFPALKQRGLETFHGYLKQIDGMLADRTWFLDKYSVIDPYGLVFYTWGIRRELPVRELKNYTAFKDRMLERPAVRRIIEAEKTPT
jgi:glutathione S-transferase